jgi:hypothetical protein
VSGFLGSGIVQMTLESFGMLGFGLGLGVGRVGEHFVVEFVLVGGAFLEGQGMLGGVEVVEFCLGFVAEKAGELGQGDRLF